MMFFVGRGFILPIPNKIKEEKIKIYFRFWQETNKGL